MSEAQVLQLYPEPQGERRLAGLYLNHRLHELGKPDQPLIYGNFLSSLDGRIALIDAQGNSATPNSITTETDWKLFQELQAQADCIITHGAYLRALAAGSLGNILQVGLQPTSDHLREWRSRHGLRPQPDIVIASGSLNFPLPDSVHEHGQNVTIATGVASDSDRVEAWHARGFEVLVAGTGHSVQGGVLIRQLRRRAYRSIYLLAGPRILETMLREGLLSRLYLTVSHQLIGGTRFHTMVTGDPLGPAGRLRLRSLYLEPETPVGTGQFFACFEPRGKETAPP